ncbi:hypothetical protein SAMN05216188_12161 [Lentzea xinjiangensis]|uniref:Uncharacterized protein n=1 Tax=Lentzea xinjiangensis TaxID=402600 RepID=A0A1H9UF93_9PSEU|nr:hypothetical protein SAMN05216188_12161 [Lentzea xinjiangensis]
MVTSSRSAPGMRWECRDRSGPRRRVHVVRGRAEKSTEIPSTGTKQESSEVLNGQTDARTRVGGRRTPMTGPATWRRRWSRATKSAPRSKHRRAHGTERRRQDRTSGCARHRCDDTRRLVGCGDDADRGVVRGPADGALGARELDAANGLLAGSTVIALVSHGQCPLVCSTPSPGGAVVVGADGSPTSEATVASRLGIDRHHVETEERDRLAGWHEKHPEVQVHRVVVRDRPYGCYPDRRAAAAAEDPPGCFSARRVGHRSAAHPARSRSRGHGHHPAAPPRRRSSSTRSGSRRRPTSALHEVSS